MLLRFGTYNLLDLAMPRTPVHRHRYGLIVEAVREMFAGRPGVLGVQEVLGETAEEAAAVLEMLADDTGMHCQATTTPGGVPAAAIAASGHSFHVGLLWSPGLEPVPGGMRAYPGGSDFWHSMITVVLDCGGPVPSKWCSYHGDPFRPAQRLHEAYRVLSAFQDARIPGGVAADWNSISADRRPDGGYFDPDTLPGQYHRKVRYQAKFDPGDPTAPPATDRSAAAFLAQPPGGLLDTAALAGVPWLPTTGHWLVDGRADDFGPRRIDTLRVTEDLAGAVRAHTTHGGPLAAELAAAVRAHLADPAGESIGAKATAVVTRHAAESGLSAAERASDHLPVSTDLDLAAFRPHNDAHTGRRP
ncbi:hypothetical protein [Kitasatospora sp. NPDC088783]|uniref:hypothetical protein n=1 Tax=Kitasatospora sp. NPDC088783 TaxID=3364077 RepID=UPI0037F67DEF